MKKKSKIWHNNRPYDMEVSEDEGTTIEDLKKEKVKLLSERAVRAEKAGDEKELKKLEARINAIKNYKSKK